MREKTKWLEKYAPLGMNIHSELLWYIVIVILVILESILFLVRYTIARGELYQSYAGEMVLIEGAIIEDFAGLTTDLFAEMVIICGVSILHIITNYMYHYQGSKMVYLMKRLPDKWELHRRCLTLPIAEVVILVVLSLVLRMIYFAIYILCTPSQCLPL